MSVRPDTKLTGEELADLNAAIYGRQPQRAVSAPTGVAAPVWYGRHEAMPDSARSVWVMLFAGPVSSPTHPGYPGIPWVEVSRRLYSGDTPLPAFECELVQTGSVIAWSDEVVSPRPDRQAMQEAGIHPAPCQRFCEGAAVHIERRRHAAEVHQMRRAVLAGQEALAASSSLCQRIVSAAREVLKWDGGRGSSGWSAMDWSRARDELLTEIGDIK